MFTGFTREAIDFLTDLRFHNNQAFYEANKSRYETLLKEPLRELCEEAAPIVQLVDPKLDTRPGRTMSRLRRDTRFSKDKSPFRDHVWLSWRYPGESRSEGFDLYWGFGPDWYGWGCGMYSADKPVMDALRLHIRREPDEVRARDYRDGPASTVHAAHADAGRRGPARNRARTGSQGARTGTGKARRAHCRPP